MNKGHLIVFSAASGAGKSTILSALDTKINDIAYSISTTTRAPRGDEKEGVEYFFIDKAAFIDQVSEKKFVEWAEVHGNFYGTSKASIDTLLDAGKTVLMDIDVQGKVQIDKIYPQATGVFIEAPSLSELESRLRSRGTDAEDAIQKRLANAKHENQFARFEGKYSYFVVNDNLDTAVAKIVRIIEQVQDASKDSE